jgi:hypothetical protein
MASIFDLMPASWWPVQPFMPPFDPAQPAMWPSGASGWTPAPSSLPPGWPAISVDAASGADSSVSDWDRAMRQALAAQSGATRDPGVGGSASYDQMVADAKRAHDFVRWVLGPPSAPQAQPIGDAMQGGGLQSVADVPRNVVATSAAALPSMVAAPGADDADAPAPGPVDQPLDLGAAYGNPNIMRQGENGRAIAAMRPSPAAAITDALLSLPRGIVEGLATTASAGGQAAQMEMQKPVDVPPPDEAFDIVQQHVTGQLHTPQGPAGHLTETLGQFLGNPTTYLGLAGLWTKLLGAAGGAFGSELAGEASRGTPAEPYATIAGAMLGGGLAASAIRGSAAAEAVAANLEGRSVATRAAPPRSPTAPVEPPHVDTATAPLVPIGPLDWDRALAAARLRGDIDWDALSARARQFHGTLDPKAQTHRTTAVLSTDGPSIIGGSGDDLTKWQRFLLRDGEVYAEYPGAHAEETVLSKSMALGYRPRALVTTWRICDKRYEKFVTSMGGVISPDRKMAIFPP